MLQTVTIGFLVQHFRGNTQQGKRPQGFLLRTDCL